MATSDDDRDAVATLPNPSREDERKGTAKLALVLLGFLSLVVLIVATEVIRHQ